MVATNQWVIENFNKYNELVFNNELPNINEEFEVNGKRFVFGVGLCKSKTYCGIFKIRPLKYYCAIGISTYYDRTEEGLRDTLVHEMCHYYIFFKGIRDTSVHGKYFKSLIAKYNRLHGFNMGVRSTDKLKTIAVVPKNESYYLMFMITKKGDYFICNAHKNYAKLINRKLSIRNILVEAHWYRSTNQMFQTWSKVRTLRGIKVTKQRFEELEAMVKNEGKEITELL